MKRAGRSYSMGMQLYCRGCIDYLFEAGNTQEVAIARLRDDGACAPVILAGVRGLSAAVDEY